MKRLISALLVAVLLTLTVSAFADEPFATVMGNIIDKVDSAEGITLNICSGEENIGSVTVQKKDGSIDKVAVKNDSGNIILYFDNEKLTVSEDGMSYTLPYSTLTVLSINQDAINRLGQTLGSMATELLNELLIRGAVTVEMTENGLTLKIQAREFFPCVDSAVAGLLEKYAGQIDEDIKAAYGENGLFSAAMLPELWNSLKVSETKPGFETLSLSLEMISEETDTLKLAIDADGKMVFDLVETKSGNGFTFTVSAAGHEYFMLMEQSENDQQGFLFLYKDNSQLMTLSYSETLISLAAMDGELTFDLIRSEEGITLKENYEGSKAELSLIYDPFTVTETLGAENGSHTVTVIRQADSEGSALCKLDVEKTGFYVDGSETPASSGSLYIRETENGYALDADLGTEESGRLAELSLGPVEIIAPDEGLVLTQEILLQLFQVVE